jgi:hypothetical protein
MSGYRESHTGILGPVCVALLGGMGGLLSCANHPGADPPPTCAPATDQPPTDLACTGLYADFKTKTVAKAARAYAPAFPLWSDGYDKSRFIALPDGASIDATNGDEWTFPVGTKVWKEFRSGQRKIETRLIWKVAADRWGFAAYVWSEDGETATRGEGRSLMVDGNPYNVPASIECNECHRGRKDKVLGFEALSLAQPAASGVTLAVLVGENRLAPPPARTTFSLPHPGLGVLHVNCGVSCHNSTPGTDATASTLRLRLGFDEVANQPMAAWQLLSSSVGVPTELPGFDGALRIAPGSPEKSAIVAAMKTRLTGQMPPIATREVDVEGVAAVESWVRTLVAR